MNARVNVINDKKYVSLLYVLCWVSYSVSYLGRLNYSAVMAEIIEGGYLSASRAGLVVTAYFICYGAGQLINGIAADRIKPKLLFLTGLILSAAANAAMGVFGSGVSMPVIWGINGFSQSMLWPSVVKIISTRLNKIDGAKAMVNISTSVAVGTLFVYVMSAGVLALFTWRVVFFAAAAVIGAIAPVWYFGVGETEKHAVDDDKSAVPDAPVGPEKPRAKQSVARLIFVSGLFPALFAVIIQGILRDGVTTWTPTLINASYQIGTSLSALMTAFIPVISILGVYAAYIINRKFFNHEILTAAALFLLATLFFILLSAGGAYNVFILVISLAAGVALMHGVNTMLISMVPLYFADTGKSASIGGALNAFTYLGSGISTYVIGYMTSGFGWGAALVSWIVTAALGMLMCLLCVKKWNRFKIVK